MRIERNIEYSEKLYYDIYVANCHTKGVIIMAVSKVKIAKRESEKKTRATTLTVTEQSRMNIRLALTVKERVARAATLSGQDLTEFAVATLSEKADQIIERHDQLILGSEDHEFFLSALSETSVREPSERSRTAAEKYRQGTRKGVRYHLAD